MPHDVLKTILNIAWNYFYETIWNERYVNFYKHNLDPATSNIFHSTRDLNQVWKMNSAWWMMLDWELGIIHANLLRTVDYWVKPDNICSNIKKTVTNGAAGAFESKHFNNSDEWSGWSHWNYTNWTSRRAWSFLCNFDLIGHLSVLILVEFLLDQTASGSL